MAEVSFDLSKPEQPTETALVTGDHYQSVGGMEGERNKSDIITPRLQVVARTSKLVGEFRPGDMVLNKQVGLGRGPITAAIVHAKKYYVEATDPEDTDTFPRRFNTSEEVRAAGLTPHDKPTYGKNLIGQVAVPAAEMLLWIKKPEKLTREEDADIFSIEIPELGAGAFALYSAQRTSYNTTFKTVNSVFELALKPKGTGIWTRRWKMHTTSEEYEKKVWEQARINPDGALPPEAAEFLAGFAA